MKHRNGEELSNVWSDESYRNWFLLAQHLENENGNY